MTARRGGVRDPRERNSPEVCVSSERRACLCVFSALDQLVRAGEPGTRPASARLYSARRTMTGPLPPRPPCDPPGLASARRMRGWMLRQVCPVPREKLINIMTPAVFVRPAQRSVPVITASQSERAAGHANYTQCPPARQKGPNPLREFKPKTWKKVEEESRGRETSTSSSPPGWDTLRRIHPSILCLLFHKHRKRSSSRRRKELHPNKEN